MSTKLFWICLMISITFATTQRKPGICPATLNIPICGMTCFNDAHCLGNSKCCRTTCNGAVCLQPLPEPVVPAESHRKPGQCPYLNIPVCVMTCSNDLQCSEDSKCCRTACGGSVCVQPVRQQRPQPQQPKTTVAPTVQSNVCPAQPGGPWVCTSTCAKDTDCGKTKKCCKNRCGALTCMKT